MYGAVRKSCHWISKLTLLLPRNNLYQVRKDKPIIANSYILTWCQSAIKHNLILLLLRLTMHSGAAVKAHCTLLHTRTVHVALQAARLNVCRADVKWTDKLHISHRCKLQYKTKYWTNLTSDTRRFRGSFPSSPSFCFGLKLSAAVPHRQSRRFGQVVHQECRKTPKSGRRTSTRNSYCEHCELFSWVFKLCVCKERLCNFLSTFRQTSTLCLRSLVVPLRRNYGVLRWHIVTAISSRILSLPPQLLLTPATQARNGQDLQGVNERFKQNLWISLLADVVKCDMKLSLEMIFVNFKDYESAKIWSCGNKHTQNIYLPTEFWLLDIFRDSSNSSNDSWV